MSDLERAELIDRTVKSMGDYLTWRNANKRQRFAKCAPGSPAEAQQIKRIEDSGKSETDAGNDVCRSIRLLLPELDSRGEDSTPLRKVLHFIAGGGGPDNVYPLWPDTKASLQKFADRLRSAEAKARAAPVEPLSTLDLPSIREAVETLFRVIEAPPPAGSQAPAWAVAFYSGGTPPKELAMTPPPHVWLIHAAVYNVAKALKLTTLSPTHSPTEITNSPFDREQKLALLKLRDLLVDISHFHSKVAVDAVQILKATEALRTILADLDAKPQAVPISTLARGNEGEGDDNAGKGKGRPRRTEARKAQQADIASAWQRFWESKCWQGKGGTPKAQFCQENNIEIEDLDTALRRAREQKSKPKSAKKRSKVGGK